LKAVEHFRSTPSLHANKKPLALQSGVILQYNLGHGSQIKPCQPKTNHYAFGGYQLIPAHPALAEMLSTRFPAAGSGSVKQ